MHTIHKTGCDSTCSSKPILRFLLQVEYPEGTEFDSSDTSVYFVKCGQVQLKAADKQLEDREVRQTVAQAAVAVQTMAATGPLSKVIIAPPPNPTPPVDMLLASRKAVSFC